MEQTKKTMEKIVALCKNRGIVYPGSEIYGGLANSWDFGPLGVEFKNNIKKAWWKKFVQESKYNVGLDSAIIMNKETWVASGHLKGFADPLMDCKACKTRHRADKLIEDYAAENNLSDKVDLGGAFCTGNCQQGVCVTINDDTYSVSPENVIEFFENDIKAKVQ